MAENESGRRWVVEPPAPDEVSFHLAVGDGVELTADQEAALSELMRTLENSDAEVTGHTKCQLSECTNKSCKPVRCATFICHHLTANLEATDSVGTSWNLMGTFRAL